jgi:ribA/ribD-fused uncharacterized protein
MINEFRGEYFFLSNFYSKPITYRGITYMNNEAAFQAQKTLNPIEKMAFSKFDPSKAKRQGRRVSLRKDWEEIKDDIMYEICKAKFSQNEDLRDKLLATGNEYLEEGTTGWHDNYWGNCSCEKCKNIKGKNILGKILMRVREELRND